MFTPEQEKHVREVLPLMIAAAWVSKQKAEMGVLNAEELLNSFVLGMSITMTRLGYSIEEISSLVNAHIIRSNPGASFSSTTPLSPAEAAAAFLQSLQAKVDNSLPPELNH